MSDIFARMYRSHKKIEYLQRTNVFKNRTNLKSCGKRSQTIANQLDVKENGVAQWW